MTKKCNVCGEEKPATIEYFYSLKYGLSPLCKPCHIKRSVNNAKKRKLAEGEKPYYVYEWFFVDTGKPFYVGKGRGRRFKERKDRSKVFKNYIKKFECEIRIVVNGLTEGEAYAEEIRIIALYRSRGVHLINKTNGGDAPPKLYGTAAKNHRSVIQLTLDGKFVRRWDYISEVEHLMGITNNLITRSCKRRGKTGHPAAGGFLWVYADDYNPSEKYAYKRGTVAKPIMQYRLDGEYIREWASAKQAALELGLHRGPLCSCLKGRYHSCGGYIWRYKEDETKSCS